ncbi:MAG: hypothetical protein ACE5GD_00165 [Candidatus Geothermarchaeales archaeon]
MKRSQTFVIAVSIIVVIVAAGIYLLTLPSAPTPTPTPTAPTGSFKLEVSEDLISARRLKEEGSYTIEITVTSLEGFSAPVHFTVERCPEEAVTWEFDPPSVTPPPGGTATCTLTLTRVPGASAKACCASMTIVAKCDSLSEDHAVVIS